MYWLWNFPPCYQIWQMTRKAKAWKTEYFVKYSLVLSHCKEHEHSIKRNAPKDASKKSLDHESQEHPRLIALQNKARQCIPSHSETPKIVNKARRSISEGITSVLVFYFINSFCFLLYFPFARSISNFPVLFSRFSHESCVSAILNFIFVTSLRLHVEKHGEFYLVILFLG